MNNLERRVIKLVQDVVNEYASTIIPTFDEICSGLELTVKEGSLPDGIDGIQKDTTIIINSQIKNKERKRFTQFHEVAHYLIEQNKDLIYDFDDTTRSQDDGYEKFLEQLCNIGAAEFLMPRKVFAELYKEREFNVGLIPYAARYFKSSAIATTIQLAQIAPHSCITAVCEYGLIPNKMAPVQAHLFDGKNFPAKRKLHIVYSAPSPATKYWLAKHTEIPEDHVINQAFLQSQPVEGESYVPFQSGKKMPCHCEALADGERVYVLFHLTPPPDPNQMSIFDRVL